METIIQELTVYSSQMRWAVKRLFQSDVVFIPYDSYFFWVLIGAIFTLTVINIFKNFKKVRL